MSENIGRLMNTVTAGFDTTETNDRNNSAKKKLFSVTSKLGKPEHRVS